MSIIFFERKREVHYLFDYLINSYSNIHLLKNDFPKLISSMPFKNSISQQLKIIQNREFISKRKEKIFYLKLDGPVLPSTFLKLSSFFSHMGDDFQCIIKPFYSSCGLNLIKKYSELKEALSETHNSECILKKNLTWKNLFTITEIQYYDKQKQFRHELKKV